MVNRPKPIPVFHTKSRLIKSFKKKVFSLKLLIISNLEYLSEKKAMNIITSYYEKEDDIYNYHIYEDLMIALILNEYKIYPKKIPKIIEGDKL